MALIKFNKSEQDVTDLIFNSDAFTQLALALGHVVYDRLEVEKLDNNMLRVALDTTNRMSIGGPLIYVVDFVQQGDSTQHQRIVIITHNKELISVGRSYHAEHNFMAYLNIEEDQSRRPLWDAYSEIALSVF